MPFILRNDNTRVLKPIIITPIKRKLVRRTKNEEVRQDNRPLIIRQQALSKSNLIYEQLKWDKAYDLTALGMTRPLEFINPSHLIGVLTSDKPFIETIGNSDVQATTNEMVNFLLSMTTPGDALKAMAIIPGVIKDFKAVNELKNLLTASGYKFMSLPRKDLNGLSVFDYYNKYGNLSQLYLSKFKEYMKIAREGLKGKKGVNEGLNAIKDAERAKTPEGRLELIRKQYLELIDEINNASLRGILKLDWWDTNTANLLGGMPVWLKAQRVGFNERPFLDRYLSNVITKVGPKLKELLDKGLLRPTKDGKHWEGLVGENYIKVDPYRYIISHLDRAQAYGNMVNVLPESIAKIPKHGTSGRKGIGWQAKHMSNPSLEFDQTLYTVISDGRKGANDGITYFSRNNGASVPLLEKPSLEPGNYRGFRTGNSNSSGVANGAAGERIEVHRDVSDPLVGGSAMDEYNFGPGVDNIKSYWNTLDFEYGAGPLAMINPKLDKLLA